MSRKLPLNCNTLEHIIRSHYGTTTRTVSVWKQHVLKHSSSGCTAKEKLERNSSHHVRFYMLHQTQKSMALTCFAVEINSVSKKSVFLFGAGSQTDSGSVSEESAALQPRHKHWQVLMQMAWLTQGQWIRLQQWQLSLWGPTPHHYINLSAFKSNSSTSIGCYCGEQTWPGGPIDAHTFPL